MTGTALGERVGGTAAPSFAEAFRVWAKIGFLSFGGPAGQIALMHRVLVEEQRWISEARFLHALNFCMLLPGPEAQQLATYVGWLLHGTAGGIVAGTLFVLPGLAVILGLSTLYAVFHETVWLASLFFGLKAAVLAIVIEAVLRIGRRALKGRAALALAGLAFVALYVFHLPFPLVVVAAGAIGFVAARVAPGAFVGRADGAAAAGADDHLREVAPSLGGAVRVVLVAAVLWAAPVVGLGLALGWTSIYPAIGLFFSKMAVVTFGGAYAVLAYVADVAVGAFGWLKPGEMLDGLAMAETTPGPLVLVLTYVGYIAAFRAPAGMPPLAGGIVGGLLTSWVTFVPCFLWIFLGAPHIERLRGNAGLATALAAITAAVVGVILNLAVFLGLHVLFREVAALSIGPFRPAVPAWSSLDLTALALFGIAALALLRLKIGIVPVLAMAAAAGVLLRLAGLEI